MTKQPLELVNLDFNSLKNNFISYLQGNPIFKDYLFSGSNLNLLIDLFAQNTEKNAFLTNMLFSEAFLDSAQLTPSVFSHAKDLNYIPRSCRSSHAIIKVDFVATAESQPYIIQKGESFSTVVKNSQYIFTIPKTLIVASSNTSFSFTTDIYEGNYVKDTYIFQTSIDTPYPRFRLTNKKVDTDSLTVAVFEDGDTVGSSYTRVTSLLDLDNESAVYFLQVDENGFYEIFFGDNIVGKQPQENSTIVLDYRITNDIIPNGASSFAINFDPTGNFNELIPGANSPKITTQQSAVGGTKQEDIESVRYYAPRFFQTQERCIVPTDFETLLRINFPEIVAVNAYGGEDADPPLFGRVIVSIAIDGFDTLPESKSNAYFDFLKRRCPIGIKPLFIDPEYTFLLINSIIRFNVNVTTNTQDHIASLVTSAITTYNTDNLNDFNVVLRYSHLTSLIDDADPSIISNLTDIKCYKKIPVQTNLSSDYIINFNFALDNPDGPVTYPAKATSLDNIVLSTSFTYQGNFVFLHDDGNGKINVVQFINTDVVKVDEVGVVDYEKGLITIKNITIQDFEGQEFIVYVIPRDKDVLVQRNTILKIEPSAIQLKVEPLRL